MMGFVVRKPVSQGFRPSKITIRLLSYEDYSKAIQRPLQGSDLEERAGFIRTREFANAGVRGLFKMNAGSFITFVTYMLRQNGIRFYKGLYVIFKLAPGLKKKYSILIEL